MRFAYPRKPHKGEPIRAELIGQIIDCLRANTPIAGQNVRVSYTTGGAVIDGTPGGAAAGNDLFPWKIRRHKVESNVQWEIYIPFGCMSVGQTLEALNPAASDGKSGHEDDAPGWCIFNIDEMADTATRQEEDADGNTIDVWDYNIEAHAKTSAKVDGVDELDAPARRLLWVSARHVPAANETPTEEDTYANTEGDEFSQVVGIVTIRMSNGDSDPHPSYKITQLADSPISVNGRANAGFDLVWYFKKPENAGNRTVMLEVKKIYCIRNSASAAGMTLEGETMTDVTGVQGSIYACIHTNPLNPSGTNAIDVIADPRNMSTDDYMTWLQLYSMRFDAVTVDWRSQSLANIQVYRR